MEKTGCIRKMDALGRLVVPMEIRKKMMIKDDDLFEVFINEETLCFRKYYRSDSYLIVAKSLADELEANSSNIPNSTEIKEKLNEIIGLLQEDK
jgi:transcriptional pleiotropic regulator of transition state genes